MKPVSTAKLAFVPMFFGGAALVSSFLVWTVLIFRPLELFAYANCAWIAVVLLSNFWWIQSLSWGLPFHNGRAVIWLLVVALHVAIAMLPKIAPDVSSTYHWLILSALASIALPLSLTGLRAMRRGGYGFELGPRFAAIWRAEHLRGKNRLMKRFRSAFHAQFWLEWRRFGWVLPFIAGSYALLSFAIAAIINHYAGGANGLQVAVINFAVPVFIAGMLVHHWQDSTTFKRGMNCQYT